MAAASIARDPDDKRSRRSQMAGSIICGVDDSQSAKGAARVARALAGQLGLELVFVRVLEEYAPEAEGNAITERLERLSAEANDLDFDPVLEENGPEGEVNGITERLERLSAEATDLNFGAGWAVEPGHPADRLAAVAKRREAAMIVVGSTGPRSSLLGSISADVSRRAPGPVAVAPPGGEAKANALAKGRRTGHYNPLHNGGEDLGFAGGIVRFSLGGQERRG